MTPHQQESLRHLADLLANAPFNLLSRRDRELVWERHVEESMRVWELVRPAPDSRWLDLGTGGGLPGLVLAILSPGTQFTLIDARAKKIAAVRSFVGALDLDNVAPVVGRAEVLAREPARRGASDVVISRALGKLATVIELSRGFVRPGGQVIGVRGGQVRREVAELGDVMRRVRVDNLEIAAVPGAVRESWLVTMRAAGPPPAEVPRPDGIPAARPLGSKGGSVD